MATTRPFLDFPRNEAGLVDKFIGTAYDVVKGVYDNLDIIEGVFEVVEEIPELAQKSVDDALEKALPPALETIQGSVNEAKEAANAAAQSAVEASKVSLMYPFTLLTSQSVYDVTVISGRQDVTTAGLALWVEGSIDYNYTILSSTLFTLNDRELYPDNAQMRIIVNARFDDLVKNFDELQKSFEEEFLEFMLNSGYEVPIAYRSGIEFTRPTQTVIYAGNTYRANPVYLPFTTTTWVADSPYMQLVVDSSIRGELASPNGAAIVGATLRDGSPATVQEAINQSDQLLRQELGDKTSPSLGVGLLAFPRTAVAQAVSSAARFLSSLRVNIWEDQFTALITNKPSANPATWDWTPAYVAASAYVKANGGGVVEFSAGTYSITRIFRLNGVSIEARGSSATYLQALPFDPGDGKPYGLIEQEPGPVISSHIRGIHLLGLPASNPNQWGMYLHADWDPTFTHGGLWMSIHDDIRITLFNYGLWSRGGYTVAHYKRPQQFLDFRSVYIQVPTGGEALRMTGQHGQINFLLGSAEGRDGNTAKRAVRLSFDPDPRSTANNASGNGESTSDVAGSGNAVQSPINVTMGSKFSIQKAEEGIYSQGARNIVLSGAWVENVGKFLTLANNSHVLIEQNHLAKAADGSVLGSAGTGYLVSCQSNSTFVWRNDNNITGTVDNFTDPLFSANNMAGFDVKLCFYNGDTTGKFKVAGYKSVGLDSLGKITLGGHKYALLSANSDLTIPLRTLNANAAPGEIVMLRANSGPITIATGGNISIGSLSAVTVPQFGVITLIRKFEVGASGEWDLVSYPEHFGSGVPSSGYYTAGTKIWRSNPSAGSFMGVVCTVSGIAGSTATFKNMPSLAV